MFGLGKRLEPVLDEAQETMMVARQQLAAVVALSVLVVVLSLATLLVVSRRD